MVLGSIGKYQGAFKYFDKALKLDAENAEVWSSKGMVLGKSKNYQEAIKCFDKVLELDPGFKPAKKAEKLAMSLDRS